MRKLLPGIQRGFWDWGCLGLCGAATAHPTGGGHGARSVTHLSYSSYLAASVARENLDNCPLPFHPPVRLWRIYPLRGSCGAGLPSASLHISRYANIESRIALGRGQFRLRPLQAGHTSQAGKRHPQPYSSTYRLAAHPRRRARVFQESLESSLGEVL